MRLRTFSSGIRGFMPMSLVISMVSSSSYKSSRFVRRRTRPPAIWPFVVRICQTLLQTRRPLRSGGLRRRGRFKPALSVWVRLSARLSASLGLPVWVCLAAVSDASRYLQRFGANRLPPHFQIGLFLIAAPSCRLRSAASFCPLFDRFGVSVFLTAEKLNMAVFLFVW